MHKRSVAFRDLTLQSCKKKSQCLRVLCSPDSWEYTCLLRLLYDQSGTHPPILSLTAQGGAQEVRVCMYLMKF